jgi:hypothetical protein
MYKDREKQKEANRRAKAKARGYDTGMTEPEGVTPAPKATGMTEGMTGCDKGMTGMVRINPRTGKPYGQSMLGLLDTPKGTAALIEYERKYGQQSPVYAPGNIHDWLAEYATSDKFRQAHDSLGPYSDDVRIGCFGPTVAELAKVTTPR